MIWRTVTFRSWLDPSPAARPGSREPHTSAELPLQSVHPGPQGALFGSPSEFTGAHSHGTGAFTGDGSLASIQAQLLSSIKGAETLLNWLILHAAPANNLLYWSNSEELLLTMWLTFNSWLQQQHCGTLNWSWLDQNTSSYTSRQTGPGEEAADLRSIISCDYRLFSFSSEESDAQ